MNSQLLANAIRMLSVDAIQKANSGHPGAPMGMADIAEVVWRRHLRHNPKNPQWFNRDRYVQSNGHGSMLIYALLHLTGYDLSMDDIRDFRQLHSRTPGHPEYGYTPGVETTTGPLGQGVANAVGMAIAEKALAAEFNKPGFNIVDHHTWLFLGDGCLMEGISHEACGLAGTLKLGNLIAIWDDNGISIDGHVEGWFAEDTAARFRAYGWHVIEGVDGHDPEEVDAAVREASRISPVCCAAKRLSVLVRQIKPTATIATARRWVQMKWRWCVNVCNGRMPLSKFLVKFMPHGMRPRKARRFNRNGMHCLPTTRSSGRNWRRSLLVA